MNIRMTKSAELIDLSRSKHDLPWDLAHKVITTKQSKLKSVSETSLKHLVQSRMHSKLNVTR